MPSKARETPVARRLPPGHRLASRETSSVNSAQRLPSFFAVYSWTNFGFEFCTSMIRYARPKTLCSFGEKLTLPDTVGRPLNFYIFAARTAPFVLPLACAIAAAMASPAAAPVTKPPVAGGCLAAFSPEIRPLTSRLGSSPNTDAYVGYQ